MDIAIITGSAGLVGSEAVRFFSKKQFQIIGIDNDKRGYFFGQDASTRWNVDQLQKDIDLYRHYHEDIRDEKKMNILFDTYGSDIKLIIHAAAQPSHDWAAKEPMTDFTINANGTLVLLEKMRKYCPEACFIFTSTNKVYGDYVNSLMFEELDTRYELEKNHHFADAGIDESMTIDASKHSLFGVSKTAADLLVQEYGRYFGLKTACFRGGCITGGSHSAACLHGFLAYLMRCAVTETPYTIFGYKGKQVRDNIHARDLVSMFWHFYQNPRCGEVYNAGGGRFSNCSVLEAIRLCEQISGKMIRFRVHPKARSGDHIWWISDLRKFQHHYPEWTYTFCLEDILTELHQSIMTREK